MYLTKKSLIYQNGEFVKGPGQGCQLYSQSLHYGNGVFEGIRAYPDLDGNPRIFKAKAHFERLHHSARCMHLELKFSVEGLTEICYELLERNNFSNAYLRPLVTTGADMSLRASKEYQLIIQAWEWGKYMGEKLLRVALSPYQRPNPKSCHVEAKVTGHYVNSILASTEAKNRGFDAALLTDMNGNIAEGAGANFFYEKDGELYTPSLGHIMPGITRQTILELCLEHNIPVNETSFQPEELENADSAFFVGTAAEVTGIASLDEYNFPLQWEESLGSRLSVLYQNLVYNKHQNDRAELISHERATK